MLGEKWLAKLRTKLETKQDNTYWEWDEDLNYINILWILQAKDGSFYQNKKRIKIGSNKPD